jgi:hypothetical protein
LPTSGVAEARDELGPSHAEEDANVLEDLCFKLVEADLRFPRIPHDALPWLKRTVRALARDRVAVRLSSTSLVRVGRTAR